MEQIIYVIGTILGILGGTYVAVIYSYKQKKKTFKETMIEFSKECVYVEKFTYKEGYKLINTETGINTEFETLEEAIIECEKQRQIFITSALENQTEKVY